MRRVNNLIPGIARCQNGVYRPGIVMTAEWLVSFTVIAGNERTVKSSSNYTHRRLLQMKYVCTCRPYCEQINECILCSISIYSKLRSFVIWQVIYFNKKHDLLLLDPLDLMLLLPETFFKFSFYQLSFMTVHVNLMKPLQQWPRKVCFEFLYLLSIVTVASKVCI